MKSLLDQALDIALRRQFGNRLLEAARSINLTAVVPCAISSGSLEKIRTSNPGKISTKPQAISDITVAISLIL